MSDSIRKEVTAMQMLIRLVAAGARGETLGNIRVDWQNVIPLAAEQRVLPLIACALLNSPELYCPTELREYLLNVMHAESSVNLVRRQRIMHLLREMKSAGIDAKVLKGYAVSERYAYPESRGSIDTDLLIEVHQEPQAISFLENMGFRINTRAATSHHTVCQHKKYGMVELHVALYDELAQVIWFRKINKAGLVQEPSIVVKDAENEFSTLGHTDQLIFLTLHMVKHFIIGGLSLRMMLDIALHFAQYSRDIDSERYWSEMEELHYDTLIGAILWIMVHSDMFQAEDFPGLPEEQLEQMQIILVDMEQGGYMGEKEKNERLDSGMEYNRQIILKEKGMLQYSLYMLAWKVRSGIKYMFPPINQLRKSYPVVNTHTFLLPIVWSWQAASFLISKFASGVLKRDVRLGKLELSGVSGERVGRFKQLNML